MRIAFPIVCLLLFFATFSSLDAQAPPCGTDAMWDAYCKAHPAQAERQQAIDQGIAARQRGPQPHRIATLRTIPVVVHIVHNGGPENIPNTMVMQGLADLNAAFANTGFYDPLTGVDTEIQFCLASQDPSGQGTSGIIRVQSSLTNMTMETQDLSLKNLSRWDPTRYLNVWLVAEITSQASGPTVAGYAYLPGAHGTPQDGIVCESRWMGASQDNSKVMVHEAGHYLGLYHTFQGGCTNNDCLADGDLVCDTPPDNSTAAVGCASPPNTCTTDDDDLSPNNPFRPVANGGLGDQPDPIVNYMDYGHLSCMSAFTQGQKDRMTDVLTTTRASLLASLGCASPCTSAIQAAFTPSTTQALVGQSVSMGGATTGATTYSWTKNGQVFSLQANPSHVFSAAGTYEIVLTAGNGDPSCTDYAVDTIYVNCNQQASFTASGTNVAPGTTVSFTNTSTGPGTTFTWLLDGVAMASTTNWSYNFATLGGHMVSLVQHGGICNDTSNTLFVAVGACGSNRANRWYFGSKAGVDFTGGNITPLYDGSTYFSGFESVATMCDTLGNLLFYTNGEQVFNRQHQYMTNGNGMRANQSSTMGSLIVPKPGSAKDYYLFTLPISFVLPYDTTMFVSTVDMSLSGGMGAVVIKCDTLMRRPTEKICVTNHCNGRDYWVVAKQFHSNAFYAYQITPSGILPPVVTHVGSVHTGNWSIAQGTMKISPDGRHLALVSGESSNARIEIFDFDNSTGRPGNPNMMFTPLLGNPYGLEFSPDSRRLYVNNHGAGGGRPPELYQLDLDAGSPAAVLGSMTLVSGPSNYAWGALQLAPNGKIYMARPNQAYFGVINNPNALGTACNFVELGPFHGYTASYGLNNVNTSLFSTLYPELSGPDTVCAYQQGVVFRRAVGSCASGGAVTWQVTGNATLQSSTDTSATVTFTAAGQATIALVETAPCGSGAAQIDVFVQPSGPTVYLGPDQQLCPGASLGLDAGAGYSSYLWHNGATTQTVQVSGPGTYWVQVGGGSSCHPRDSITVTAASTGPTFSLGPDQGICDGQVAQLQAGQGWSTYLWQDGFDQATYSAWLPGTYWVAVTGPQCAGQLTDTIQVYGLPAPVVDLGADTILCPGDAFTLQPGLAGGSYLWSDGSSANSLMVSQPGTYWLQYLDANGCIGTDTLLVDLCVGLEEVAANAGLDVWPNPTGGSLHYALAGVDARATARLGLWDVAGRRLRSWEAAAAGTLDLRDFAAGMYLLVVECEGRWWRVKLEHD